MSKAEELAQAYADAVSTHRLESLYGTSKSYTLEKAQERDEAHAALTAELRRLAALEKAIMDAEPVAWMNNASLVNCEIDRARYGESGGDTYTSAAARNTFHNTPLYTLNGIKP